VAFLSALAADTGQFQGGGVRGLVAIALKLFPQASTDLHRFFPTILLTHDFKTFILRVRLNREV
jgi:hypothetical protein